MLHNVVRGGRQKVGVATFHRCINYGSYWQARCLLEGIQEHGYPAEILDHQSWRVQRAEWRCALRPVLPERVPGPDLLRYGIKLAKFERAVGDLPRSSRFPLDQPNRAPPHEIVVVGSDEVWNLRHPWYARCPLFFGMELPACRLIAYAASFGNHDASAGLEACWAQALRRFESISVRDRNSQRLIHASLGWEPELVLDPCLQFPPLAARQLEERFVVVYGHNFSGWFARQVRRWASQRGIPLLSVGYRNDWADRQWLSAGPFEFLNAMTSAEAVVSNFFHGCVFSLNYSKPFVCEASPYRSTKVSDLMRTAGGAKHLVNEETPAERYDEMLTSALAPDIAANIEGLRRSSNAYLKRALA